jgi:hypothetical protein
VPIDLEIALKLADSLRSYNPDDPVLAQFDELLNDPNSDEIYDLQLALDKFSDFNRAECYMLIRNAKARGVSWQSGELSIARNANGQAYVYEPSKIIRARFDQWINAHGARSWTRFNGIDPDRIARADFRVEQGDILYKFTLEDDVERVLYWKDFELNVDQLKRMTRQEYFHVVGNVPPNTQTTAYGIWRHNEVLPDPSKFKMRAIDYAAKRAETRAILKRWSSASPSNDAVKIDQNLINQIQQMYKEN